MTCTMELRGYKYDRRVSKYENSEKALIVAVSVPTASIQIPTGNTLMC